MISPRYSKLFFFTTTFLLSGLHLQNWVGADASFTVQRVAVKGNSFLSAETILKTAQVPQGERTYRVDVTQIEEQLETLPFVEEVQVSRIFPSTVQIYVKEREAIALLSAKGLSPIAANGEVLPQVEAGVRLDLPVVSGVSFKQDDSKRVLSEAGKSLCDFISVLRAQNPVMYHDVSEFHLDGKGNLVLFLYSHGVPVYLGKQQWLERCDRLQTVLQQLPHNGNGLAAIDLRFENQVVTRRT